MPRTIRRRPLHWGVIAGAAGALLAACVLTGCPGDIDPSIMMPSSGSGGSGAGTGGGSGGGSADCTGNNAGDQLITSTCVTSCHNPTSDTVLGGGLDLTIDSNISSRLVGVKSAGTNGSACGSYPDPYLIANSNPAKGLLITKITGATCGTMMPQIGTLTATQRQCIIQWATTLTSP